MNAYDVIVIGSGPGGYVAAIRASQLGLKTAVIEKSELGGICLNWGCIPTKALLESAHLYQKIKKSKEFGIVVNDFSVDFSSIIERSRKVANRMSKGVEYLMKKNQIDVIYGFGVFKDTHNILVYKDESLTEKITELQTKKTIIATGARAKNLPDIKIDQEHIIDYKKAMSLEELPKKLLIIGAGAIGIEFADFYHSLGTEVSIVELMPNILPLEDEEIARTLENIYKKRNIKIYTNSKVQSHKINNGKIDVEILDNKNQIFKDNFDKILLAVGIIANTEKLNLNSVFVELNKDKVKVNKDYQTTNPDIYAIGDCINTPALAHVASHEGIRAAEHIFITLQKEKKISSDHKVDYKPINYNWIPSCVYCSPEIASIGFTEKKVKEMGIEFKVGKFPYNALGRAHASGEAEGFVKVIIGKKYHNILGIHIIGKNATEIISEGLVSTNAELLAEDLAKFVHPHPTISEAIMEAFGVSIDEPINI